MVPTMRCLVASLLVLSVSCASAPAVGERLGRTGEEIVVAGQLFHVGAPVVLWLDPDGYDAYRPWPHFRDPEEDEEQKARYGFRRLVPGGGDATEESVRRARNGQWKLEDLQQVVDQFVLHYDVCGTSEVCYRVLQDDRHLSVHFMLDLDGTIYQTLDVEERAWHATIANDRSVGIEIAQVGARQLSDATQLDEWYEDGGDGTTLVTLPERFGDGGLRTEGYQGRTATPEPHYGNINDLDLIQYDFTPEQYESLAKLTAALHRALPGIRLDYPKTESGAPLPRAFSREEFDAFTGVLGHFHVQTNKQDPGPAFDWERLMTEAAAHLD